MLAAFLRARYAAIFASRSSTQCLVGVRSGIMERPDDVEEVVGEPACRSLARIHAHAWPSRSVVDAPVATLRRSAG